MRFVGSADAANRLYCNCFFHSDAMRKLSSSAAESTSSSTDSDVTVYFNSGSTRTAARGKEGSTILDIVMDNQDLLDLDGFGACEGTIACSTCHVILKSADFDRIPNAPLEEELDMLDLAYDLTDTSRLGCQISITKELDGLEVAVPANINDQRLS